MGSEALTLELEWAYGYRGHQCRNNLHYNKDGEIVYFVAGVAIVHDTTKNQQKFYKGHSDDILCLCMDTSRTLVGTGQIGRDPYICIWDSTTLKTVSILKDLGHHGGVGVVAFSHDGHHFLSVGLNAESTVLVWDARKAKVLSRANCDSGKIFDAQFHPSTSNLIVTCGLKHIFFWKLCGNVLSASKGDFGMDMEPQTILCLGFGPNAVTFSGALSGCVFLWENQELQGSVDDAHEGGVFCLSQTKEGYVTGGRDGRVRLWDDHFKAVSTIDMKTLPNGYANLWVRAVSCLEDMVLVGTQSSEVFVVSLRDRDHPQCVMNGHGEGELWALATHPKRHWFATAGDDQSVRIWDSLQHKLVLMTSVDQWVRSAGFSHDGALLAVGLANGEVIIFKSKDLSEASRFRDRKRPIHELKFSPSGEYLAVGCNDGGVDMYHVSQRFKKTSSCPDCGSHITHLDWSMDGKHIQINTGTGDRLLFKIPGCKRVTIPDEIKAIKWKTWTCVIGPQVAGMWPKYSHTKDINAVDANVERKLLASGDDFGMVKLMHFPLPDRIKKGCSSSKSWQDILPTSLMSDGLTTESH